MTDMQIPELDQLQDSVSRFRELINEPRRHYALFQRRKDFNDVCSAMDIIGDILFALGSYIKSPHNDQGLAYLEIFGVLQGLIVQQDAVRQLHKIITGEKIDLETVYPDIKAIRGTRNRTAGHPVSDSGPSNFLVRYTVSKRGFELWTYDQVGGRTTERIVLPTLIKINSAALVSEMSQLIDYIQTDDRKHKEDFMGNSLEALFNNSVYFSSKVFEGVSGRNPMGTVGLECIKGIVEKFVSTLEERGSHFEQSGFVFHNIPKLKYALSKFEEYMKGEEAQNEDDAYIVASFIQLELGKLAAIAKEIDEDYKIDDDTSEPIPS